ncbi:hypothetical protein C7431_11114 [Pantoea allii]|uniref:Uncharacterized protein n=1 Tax=Pantoea allii TaxID=574096 RepID=A0A2V2BCU3_9GAMM|nr:hypothetical protein [Pantoea allii]PWK94279.1 hypothetical protein C7431_11114 [Pantoea allii]
MEQKDQRLEIRIPGQMVDQLDEIRTGMEFTPSRSDLVRTFIEQGIADFSAKRLNGSQVRSDKRTQTEELPFASRLLIYFQIAGYDKIERWEGNHKLKYSMREVISNAYTNRWHWFAKLNKDVLTRVHNSFSAPLVLSLLDDEPVPEICEELSFVSSIKNMFDEICDVKNPDSYKYWNDFYTDRTKETLSGIEKVAEIKSIPLKFYGFTRSEKRLKQMYEFVELACNYEKTDRTFIRPRHLTSAEDLRENYALMLKVFDEVKQDGKPFDYESLDLMITRLARMPEWPLKLF